MFIIQDQNKDNKLRNVWKNFANQIAKMVLVSYNFFKCLHKYSSVKRLKVNPENAINSEKIIR